MTPNVPDTHIRIIERRGLLSSIWCTKVVLILSKMSDLHVFAAVCVAEQGVESIFYHARRDWQRMHLRWQQDMEEVCRTGRGQKYAEPVMRSMKDVRKECYRNF